MNNKGFAISGLLYGILLLFMMILLSLLYVLVTRINRLTVLVEDVSSSIEEVNYEQINTTVDASNYYITPTRAKYELKINNNSCFAYLPKNILLKINGNKINYLLPDENGEINASSNEGLKELPLIDCENNNISSFTIVKGYSSFAK